MTAIRAGDLRRFREGGWRDYPLMLVFGTDEGAVRETASRLITAAAGPDPDPLNLIRLDGDLIAQDPARLADEARTFGLFGGARVLHISGASRTPLAAVQALADDPADNTVIIFEAGDLKPGTGLRGLAERHKAIAAIPCYADSFRDLQALIDDTVHAHDKTLTRDARESLLAALGADRQLSRSELEKLMLYAADRREIDAAMVADIVSDAGRHDTGGLIDMAFIGNVAAVEPEANRLFAAGTHPSAVLSQLLSHTLLLRRLLRAHAKGQSVETLARQARLHFSRVPTLERVLRHWSAARMDRLVPAIADTVLATRRVPRLAESLTIRTLWSVARMSGAAVTGEK